MRTHVASCIFSLPLAFRASVKPLIHSPRNRLQMLRKRWSRSVMIHRSRCVALVSSGTHTRLFSTAEESDFPDVGYPFLTAKWRCSEVVLIRSN
ncbi:hypothetical protein L207DRAFT_515726, partial [Hyaloscypha variabilis F]